MGASLANSRRVFAALARSGAPLRHDGVTEETFAVEQTVYQIGVPPIRVDILTSISGCVFTNAWTRRMPGVMYSVPVNFISLPDLISNKRASGRSSDLDISSFLMTNDYSLHRLYESGVAARDFSGVLV